MAAGKGVGGEAAADDMFEQLEVRPEGADCEQGALAGGSAGGLRRHAAWWHANAKSKLVREWVVSGFPLCWKGVPAPACELSNNPSCFKEESHTVFVRDSVHTLLRAGAVRRAASKPRCVSPLAVVPKKGGKLRLILNLKHVYKYLSVPKFKYESLRALGFLARPDDLMFSIDLQDGYWQVDMAASAHTYLGFEWEGQYYEFTVLPFGLATAPWAFTKVMREVCGVLRTSGVRTLNYLDDFLFMCGPSESAALAQQARVLQVFRESGLTINKGKSVLKLSRQVKHLGFAFDSASGNLTIPQERWVALQQQVSKLVG